VKSPARKRRQFHTIAARRPFAALRLAVTLLALLAFTAQSYLIQTHIHGLPASLDLSASGTQQAVSSSVDHNKSPLDGDPTHCPICQDYLIAGSAALPAVIVAPVPTFAFAAQDIFVALFSARKIPSHSWLGRAPPHA
jgi:hypothetical protein